MVQKPAYLRIVDEPRFVNDADAIIAQGGDRFVEIRPCSLVRTEFGLRQQILESTRSDNGHQMDSGHVIQTKDLLDQVGCPVQTERIEVLSIGPTCLPERIEDLTPLPAARADSNEKEPHSKGLYRPRHRNADENRGPGKAASIRLIPPALEAIPQQGWLGEDGIGAGIDLPGEAIDSSVDRLN